MKKIFLSAILVVLYFTSCTNPSKENSYQQVGSINNKWEWVAGIYDVKGYKHSCGLVSNMDGAVADVFAKAINGVTYYKLGNDVSVWPNPEYGTDSVYGRYKWMSEVEGGCGRGRVVIVFNF
jgi:hypothetical protein